MKFAGIFVSGPKVSKFPGPKLSLAGGSKMSADDIEMSLMDSDRRLMAYKKKVKMREDMNLYAKQKEKEKILL